MSSSPSATATEDYRAKLRGGGTLPPVEPCPNEPPTLKIAKPKAQRGKAVTADRFKVLNAFVDYSMQTVSLVAQSTWTVLWRETKPNGLAQISHSQIAQRIGKCRRTAIRATDELEKARRPDRRVIVLSSLWNTRGV
jgi:hypothetical protein